MNIALWLITLVSIPVSVAVTYRFFGKTGLVVLLSLLTILSNLQTLLQVNILGITTTLGNVTYGATYLVIDIICENHGKKAAKNAIIISTIALIFFTVNMTLAVNFSVIQATSTISNYNALSRIFNLLPRIIIASFIAYYVSHAIAAFIYLLLKKATKNKYIWSRNNLSTTIAAIFDNAIFTIVAFYGLLTFNYLLELSITSYITSIIVSIINTPIVYLTKRMYNNNLIKD
jgi:uncharacterized integral membrane protein (TIGR00697 family)